MGQNTRRDYPKSVNRPPRFDQIHPSYVTESHRGGSSAGRNFKRNQPRGAQPIYQPPAQRNTFLN